MEGVDVWSRTSLYMFPVGFVNHVQSDFKYPWRLWKFDNLVRGEGDWFRVANVKYGNWFSHRLLSFPPFPSLGNIEILIDTGC